jgi:ferric-dicitrate binding protein FerR (iron transport regulator)
MDCDQAQNLMAAQMAEELPLDERASLDAHLNGCANCRATDEAWRREDAELRQAFAPRRAAATALAERVIAQVRTLPLPQRQRRRQRWTMFLIPIASAAAGFVLAVLIVPRLMQPEVVERIVEKEKKVFVEIPKEGKSEESKSIPKDEKKVSPEDVKKPIPDDGKAMAKSEKDVAPDYGKKVAPSSDVKPELAAKDKVEPEVQLAIATGPVETRAEGAKTWQTIEPGSKVAYGTPVRTQKDACCEFLCPDGSEVRLNRDSEVVFLNDRELELKQGQVWSSIPYAKRKSSEPLKIHACDSVVSGEGAKFDLRCSSQEGKLSVLEGRTVVEGSDKKGSLTVGKGEVARIVRGENGALQKEGVSDETSGWMDAILMRKGNSPEVERRVLDALAQVGHAKADKAAENEIRRWGESCVSPLTRYVQSEGSRQQHTNRVAAARILSDLAPAWAIGDLIELLRDPDPEVRVYAATALHRLTGQTQGYSLEHWRLAGKEMPTKNFKAESSVEGGYQAWRKWWEQNKSKYPSRP